MCKAGNQIRVRCKIGKHHRAICRAGNQHRSSDCNSTSCRERSDTTLLLYASAQCTKSKAPTNNLCDTRKCVVSNQLLCWKLPSLPVKTLDWVEREFDLGGA